MSKESIAWREEASHVNDILWGYEWALLFNVCVFVWFI